MANANLSNASLNGVDLQSANLSAAILYGADLSGADLRGASEEAAQLLLDMEAEQPALPGPRTPAAEPGSGVTYETVSKRWTEDGICVSCLRSNEKGGVT